MHARMTAQALAAAMRVIRAREGAHKRERERVAADGACIALHASCNSALCRYRAPVSALSSMLTHKDASKPHNIVMCVHPRIYDAIDSYGCCGTRPNGLARMHAGARHHAHAHPAQAPHAAAPVSPQARYLRAHRAAQPKWV